MPTDFLRESNNSRLGNVTSEGGCRNYACHVGASRFFDDYQDAKKLYDRIIGTSEGTTELIEESTEKE